MKRSSIAVLAAFILALSACGSKQKQLQAQADSCARDKEATEAKLPALQARVDALSTELAFRKDWNATNFAFNTGMDGYDSSRAFTDDDRMALIGKADHLLELMRAHPDLAAAAVNRSKTVGDARDELANTKIGVVSVDAREPAHTGARVEMGWEFRVDALEGEWTAKANSAEWPMQDGRGYPDWKPKPGAPTGDHRICNDQNQDEEEVPMGALIGVAGKTCAGQGFWKSYDAYPALLVLQMNDSLPKDNDGRIKARYMVRKVVAR